MTKKETLFFERLDTEIRNLKNSMANIDKMWDYFEEFLNNDNDFREKIGNRQVCEKCLYTESKHEMLLKCPECGDKIEDEYTRFRKFT